MPGYDLGFILVHKQTKTYNIHPRNINIVVVVVTRFN